MKNFLKHSLWWQIGLTCVGSAFNLLDFADYSTYLYLVPISVLLLVAALLSGLVTYKRLTIATRSKVIAIGCMVICAIQLPDVLFRRLPATLSNPNIAREQALRAKAFEEKVEKIRKSQVLPKPAP